MKKIFAILLAVVLPFAALAQQTASTAAMGAAAESSLVGTYRGMLVGYRGADAFQMTIARHEASIVTGSILFPKPEKGCGNEMPISGKVGADGIIALEMHGKLKGCDYTLTLTASADGTLAGDLNGYWKPWKVVLAK